MKTKIFSAAAGKLATIACAALFLLSYANADGSPVAVEDLISANTGFAFSLLQELAGETPTSNIFISPYSASTVLEMVSTGADGTTLEQMRQALGTTNLNLAELDQANKIVSTVLDAHNTNFILSTANAVWYEDGLPVKAAFIEGDAKYFDAAVKGVVFTNPETPVIINEWASNETHGNITNVVQSPMPPSTVMLLANAVYFLGNWETPFATNLTANASFGTGAGSPVTVPMMQRTGTFSYCAGDTFQAVRLPYRGNNIAMYVFLPAADSSVEDLLSEMDGSWWQQELSGAFSVQEGLVELPRFSLEFSASLKPALQALGMELAFTQAADFSRMTREPVRISDVDQKAMIKVNERGTEAAAVTTVTIVSTAVTVPVLDFQMIVDRPFLVFIQDDQAQTILFSGVVFDPSN